MIALPKPGRCETLAPYIRRVIAPNGGAMTGDGTASYILGEGDCALIDPGPDDETHRAALLSALESGERIACIFVTHTHRDHSAGAMRLATLTGAPTLAFGAHGAGMSAQMRRRAEWMGGLDSQPGADWKFTPDILLEDGAFAPCDCAFPLRALWTPGHASNHLCLALEGQGALFSGDHVMGWSTSLVAPPDGDLSAYLRSLARLRERALAGADKRYFPAHGAPVDEPLSRLDALIAHRERRTAQIRRALRGGGETRIGELVARVYANAPPAGAKMAERMLFAHLLFLMDRGEARWKTPGDWDAPFLLQEDHA